MWFHIASSLRRLLENLPTLLQIFLCLRSWRWMCGDCEMNQIISCNTKSNQIWLSFILSIVHPYGNFSLSCYTPEPFSITLIPIRLLNATFDKGVGFRSFFSFVFQTKMCLRMWCQLVLPRFVWITETHFANATNTVTMILCKIVCTRKELFFIIPHRDWNKRNGVIRFAQNVRSELLMLDASAGCECLRKTQKEIHLIDWIMKSLRVEPIIVKRILHGTSLININDGGIGWMPGCKSNFRRVCFECFMLRLIDSGFPLSRLLLLCLFFTLPIVTRIFSRAAEGSVRRGWRHMWRDKNKSFPAVKITHSHKRQRSDLQNARCKN